MKTPSHLPADVIIKLVNIPRRTFFGVVITKNVDFIQMHRSQKLYSVKSWNAKNPDYQINRDIDN